MQASRATWIGVAVVAALGVALVGGWFDASPAVGTLDTSRPHEPEPTLPSVVDDAAPAPAPVSPRAVEPTPLAAPDVAPDAAAEPAQDAAPGTLRGRALRLADRSPLAGWHVSPKKLGFAAILARDDDDEDEDSPDVILDADGRFELHDVDPELKRLWLVAPTSRMGNDPRVRLPEDAFARDLELIVDTGWIIEGRVRSSTGATLPTARVITFASDDSTDDAFLALSKVGMALGRLSWAALLPSPSEDPRFAEAEWDASTGITRADPGGHYRVLDRARPRNGTTGLTVMAFAEGHGFDLATVELEGEQPGVVRADDLVLAPAGSLAGRVVGADGYPHPVEAIDVLLRRDASGVTPVRHPQLMPVPFPRKDEDGLREPGQPVHDDWRTTPSFEDGSDPDFDFRTHWLEPGHYVLHVEKTPDPRDAWPRHPALDRGKAQREALLGVDGTSYAAPDLLLTEVEVRAGETTRLDIALPWGGAVAGRVTDRAGAPVVDAYVFAEQRVSWNTPEHVDAEAYESLAQGSLKRVPDPDGGSRATLEINHGGDRTDDDGRFVIDRLPPGPLFLGVGILAEELGLAPTERPVEIVPARTLTLDLVLEHVDPPAASDAQR